MIIEEYICLPLTSLHYSLTFSLSYPIDYYDSIVSVISIQVSTVRGKQMQSLKRINCASRY